MYIQQNPIVGLIIIYTVFGCLTASFVVADIFEYESKHDISIGAAIIGVILSAVFWPVPFIVYALKFISAMYKWNKEK